MKKSVTIKKSLMDASQSRESEKKSSAPINCPQSYSAMCRSLKSPGNASVSESSSTSPSSTSSTSYGNILMNNIKHEIKRSSHSSSIPNCNSASSLISMTPSMIEVSSRSSIADSFVKQCRGSTTSYDNKNTMFMMINRSGSSTAKKIIAAINTSCDEVEASLSKHCGTSREYQQTSPEKEIFILAQWTVDSYYRIVIRSNNGIEAIVRAMRTFPYSRRLQECCCLCLGNLCCTDQHRNAASQSSSLSSASQLRNANTISQHSTGNILNSKSCHSLFATKTDNSYCCPASLRCIGECNGVHYIVAAMMNFPQSVAIQSAGCDALRNMQDLIFRQTNNRNVDHSSDNHIGKILDLSFADEHDNEVREYDDILDFSTSSHTSIAADRVVISNEKNVPSNFYHKTATTSTCVVYDDLIRVLTNAREMFLNPMQRYVAMTLLAGLLNQQHVLSS